MARIRHITLLLISTLLCLNLQGQGIDYQMLCNIQQHRTPVMDNTMRWVSNSLVLAPALPASMAISGWAGHNDQTLQATKQTGISLIATAGITMGLKAIIKRPRPYVKYEDDLIPVTSERSFSFPSGHTSFAFSTATSLSLQYPKWYVITPAFLWATSIGFSRMYLGVHYPSDVLTGAVIGALAAYLSYQIQQRLQEERSEVGLPETKGIIVPICISF